VRRTQLQPARPPPLPASLRHQPTRSTSSTPSVRDSGAAELLRVQWTTRSAEMRGEAKMSGVRGAVHVARRSRLIDRCTTPLTRMRLLRLLLIWTNEFVQAISIASCPFQSNSRAARVTWAQEKTVRREAEAGERADASLRIPPQVPLHSSRRSHRVRARSSQGTRLP